MYADPRGAVGGLLEPARGCVVAVVVDVFLIVQRGWVKRTRAHGVHTHTPGGACGWRASGLH